MYEIEKYSNGMISPFTQDENLWCIEDHSPPQSLGIIEVNKIFSKYFANILNLHEVYADPKA